MAVMHDGVEFRVAQARHHGHGAVEEQLWTEIRMRDVQIDTATAQTRFLEDRIQSLIRQAWWAMSATFVLGLAAGAIIAFVVSL